MNAFIYVEGGATGPASKDVDIRCREGFRKLLENCGFAAEKRMPRLIACGSRTAAFDQFKSAHRANDAANFVALWIDSEEPLSNLNAAWRHLQQCDQCPQPAGAVDEQVLFMTTCMETWFVADREALKAYFKGELQATSLPPLDLLENRDRHDVQRSLIQATRNCSNAYAKGVKSYEILGKLSPAALEQYLPSFVRVRRILKQRL